MNHWTLAFALTGVLWISAAAAADQPTPSGGGGSRAATRQAIRSTHILDRPYYRFGHFYGNTVRRRYYRGTSVQPRRGR